MTFDPPAPTNTPDFPVIKHVGIDGLIVSFAPQLTDTANRAAIAFGDAVRACNWDAVSEVSSTLVSTYVGFDPLAISHVELTGRLASLLQSQDWSQAPMNTTRKRWHVPTVFGTDLAPQLDEAAAMAGLSVEAAIASICAQPVRVQTVGFAPGQPYLGTLPPAWDIPRQTTLTPKVPQGALVVAIRQLVLFSVAAPTGWRHIGQTNFPLFRPDREPPFLLGTGDEVQFVPVDPDTLERTSDDPMGGATCEELTS